MAGEWASMVFTDAVQVNPSVPLRKGQKYPFVEMQAVEPSWRDVSESERRVFTSSGARFMSGDTLMARITPCLENGKIARYRPCCGGNEPAFGSTEFIVIRGRDGVTDNDYVYYLTNWQEFRHFAVSQMTGSSGRQRVPASALENFLVPVPPLAEQRAIAHILGTLDDTIELNRRMNRTLEEMARAIFKSWFVDFDPVRAKSAVRREHPTWTDEQVGRAACPKLKPEIAALFPDSFQDSELGEIPMGWSLRPLPEIMHINPTRLLPKGTLAPYLDMANMPTQGPSPDTFVMREMGSGIKFRNGDTLIARITPCLENGKTAFIDSLADGEVGWGSTEYIVFRPKGAIPPLFAYLLARTDEFRMFAIQQMTGSSGRQRVPAASLEKYRIVTPDIDSPLYLNFGNIVSPMFDRIRASMLQSRTLTAFRDALLPKLLSGELQAPDAERIVGGSV